jgi:hypothetical protein
MNTPNVWINRTVIVLAIVALGGWGWWRWRAAQAPAPQAPVTAAFPGGPIQMSFDEAAGPEERRKALAQLGAPLERMTDEFFNLSPAEQQKFLDRQIDQMLKIERDTKAGRGPRPQGPGGGDVQLAFSPADHLGSTTPERRAREQEYFRRLRERRKERGIDDDGSMLFVAP